VVAIFDSGVDLDQTGQSWGPNPDVHLALRDASMTQSRVLTNELIDTGNGIEVNSANVDPYCPNQPNNPDARHGTGVSGIAVGEGAPSPFPYWPGGHAPDARLISYAITLPNAVSSFGRWVTSASVMLAATQRLANYMLEKNEKVHVLNISFDGWPEPSHPTQVALDWLEREFDTLVVVLGGNEGDGTLFSHGFVNGLSVGNVHAFTTLSQSPLTQGRYPHRYSSRGPLVGDPERYFPDLCATGAGAGITAPTSINQATDPHIIMPLCDHAHPWCTRNSTPWWGQFNYSAQGSSMSSPQVAGAAALYRSYRQTATAQETRAALLLCTIDPFVDNPAYTPYDTTYTGRNTVGVGYVRNNLLARFAQRSDNALGQSVTLSSSTSKVDLTYASLTSGQYYAVAIAWPRPSSGEGMSSPWANVDLEVRTPGGLLVARSDSPRTSHERLVFQAPGTSLLIRVVGADLLGQTVTVFVAARSLGNDGSIRSRRSIPGYVTRIQQESACSAPVPDQRVKYVLPSLYQYSYGSCAFRNFSLPITSIEGHQGFVLGSGARSHGLIFSDAVTGAPDSTGYKIRALAFRTFNPLPSCVTAMTLSFTIHMGLLGPGSLPPPTSSNGMTLVASNVQVPVRPPQWNVRQPDTWPIIVPLDASFHVSSGQSLAMWLSVDTSPSCTLHVDATYDWGSFAPTLWTHYSSCSGGGCFQSPYPGDGYVPIIGIVEEGQLSTHPELTAYGFPVIDRYVLFQVLLNKL
jgi:hypothetical protein